MAVTSSRLARRDRAPQATYERIREAALHEFATKGFHATGIRDIARRAGIYNSAIYHYSPSKEDLLLGLLTQGMEAYIQCELRALAEVSRPEEELVALVQTHVFIHAASTKLAKILTSELPALEPSAREEVVALRDQSERFWSRVLASGIEAGAFDLPEPRVARIALIRMAASVSLWYRPEGGLSIDALAHTFADLALAMVRSKRDGRPLRAADLSRPDPARLRAIVETEFAGVPA